MTSEEIEISAMKILNLLENNHFSKKDKNNINYESPDLVDEKNNIGAEVSTSYDPVYYFMHNKSLRFNDKNRIRKLEEYNYKNEPFNAFENMVHILNKKNEKIKIYDHTLDEIKLFIFTNMNFNSNDFKGYFSNYLLDFLKKTSFSELFLYNNGTLLQLKKAHPIKKYKIESDGNNFRLII